MHVVGYRRVSTQDQASSAHSLDAQRDTIADHATRKDWTVGWKADQGATGSKVNPGLREALELLRTKQADALVVTKMDRVARSVLTRPTSCELHRSRVGPSSSWTWGMDLSTPSGKAMAQMLSVFAELEWEMIRSRTRDGLAVARAKVKQAHLVHCRRPSADRRPRPSTSARDWSCCEDFSMPHESVPVAGQAE